MDQEALLQELRYREVGYELARSARIVDLDYAMRCAAAMGEIYDVLRQERVDSRTRMRRVQSIMLRHGVFGPRPAASSVGETLEEYLHRPEPSKETKTMTPEKPRRGRPRKYPQ